MGSETRSHLPMACCFDVGWFANSSPNPSISRSCASLLRRPAPLRSTDRSSRKQAFLHARGGADLRRSEAQEREMDGFGREFANQPRTGVENQSAGATSRPDPFSARERLCRRAPQHPRTLAIPCLTREIPEPYTAPTTPARPARSSARWSTHRRQPDSATAAPRPMRSQPRPPRHREDPPARATSASSR
jgi:hypothetical protein